MNSSSGGKLVILSAPSGAGKTTIMKEIVKNFPSLEFSVSATSRPPRENEVHGRDYYFLTEGDFRAKIARDEFVEWEEVYNGNFYGTLKSEMERIWDKGNSIIFDVDVKGGLRLKNIFGVKALSIFIMPPSIAELEKRLRLRGTETDETLRKRVAKAETEIKDSDNFDVIVINDDLDKAVGETRSLIAGFLKQ